MNKCNDKYIGDPYSLAVKPRHVGFTFADAVHLLSSAQLTRLMIKVMVLINKNKRLKAPNYYFKMERDVRKEFYRF